MGVSRVSKLAGILKWNVGSSVHFPPYIHKYSIIIPYGIHFLLVSLPHYSRRTTTYDLACQYIRFFLFWRDFPDCGQDFPVISCPATPTYCNH